MSAPMLIPAGPDWYVIQPDAPPIPVLGWYVVGSELRALVPPTERGGPIVMQDYPFERHPEWKARWSPNEYQHDRAFMIAEASRVPPSDDDRLRWLYDPNGWGPDVE